MRQPGTHSLQPWATASTPRARPTSPHAPPQLGGPLVAKAAAIVKHMRVDGLTRLQVKSHMQKYQQKLAALAAPG